MMTQSKLPAQVSLFLLTQPPRSSHGSHSHDAFSPNDLAWSHQELECEDKWPLHGFRGSKPLQVPRVRNKKVGSGLLLELPGEVGRRKGGSSALRKHSWVCWSRPGKGAGHSTCQGWGLQPLWARSTHTLDHACHCIQWGMPAPRLVWMEFAHPRSCPITFFQIVPQALGA